jgi:1-acyl-sn-glycerol-3-phosphate acyltransferase
MIFHMLVNGVWMTLLFPFALLLLPFNPKSGSVWLARRIWAPVLVKASGARLVVHGAEHVDPRRPTVYMSNHASTLDIPVLFMAIPVDFRYVAKSSLRWVPVLGWYLWAAGHILIDRGVRHKAMASLEKAGAKIRRGTSIVVYPEGTRSDDGRILPFKKGGFSLAMESGVAVCPVTIVGTSRLMPKNSWRINPVEEIHVRIGAPLDASAYGPQGRDALMRDVRKTIIAQSLELGGPGGVGDDAAVGGEREGMGHKRAALG